MIELNVCPSLLKEGYSTYCPRARRDLFDGKEMSPILEIVPPSGKTAEGRIPLENAGRISLSGVQPKFSMIADNGKLRYTAEGEQGTHILKPVPTGYHLIEKQACAANEHVTMQIASQVYSISTAANCIVFYKGGEPAYLTRRFDVHEGGKYQQEDFASLMGYTKANGGSDYKYCNGSYEECGEIIRMYVKAASVDLMRFFRLVLFNFISLNDDAHLKNFSLINTGREYRLSPAYDLINTSLHLYQPRLFALDKGLFREGMTFSDVHTVNRRDFEEFGRRLGLSEAVISREIDRFSALPEAVRGIVARSFLPEELKKQYLDSMKYRCYMVSEK